MTRDDILRMAREAGIDVKAAFPRNPDVLTRFAQLAVDAAQPAAGPDAQPVAFLHVGGVYGDELEEWELEAEQVLCDELNEKHINKPTALPLYLHPPAADVQPVAWVDLLKEADQIVKNKPTWKSFIDGTPLSNDIAVWMADFAQKYATPAPDVQPVAWMYTAHGKKQLTFTDQRPVEAYHTHFDKSTPLYAHPPICKQDLHVDQWNCNIRDSVDRLLEQAGFAPDSSVRHQLAMMKLSKGDKK